MYVHLVGMSGVSLTIEQQYSGANASAAAAVWGFLVGVGM
jgi:hypothetical protein